MGLSSVLPPRFPAHEPKRSSSASRLKFNDGTSFKQGNAMVIAHKPLKPSAPVKNDATFNHWLFETWFNMIPARVKEQKPLLEPFAGSNQLVKRVEDIYGLQDWACYDSAPSPNNRVPSHPIVMRDPFKSFPEGHRVAITQPPYLSPGPSTKDALQLLLDHVDFVAAIVPAPFPMAGLFHDRLFAVIYQAEMLLALFVPTSVKKHPKDFLLCRGEEIQGWYLDLLEKPLTPAISGSA